MWPSLALSLLAPPLCWACGERAPERDALCRRCRSSLRWLGPRPVELRGLTVWAPIAYEGPARALVRALKFGGAVAVADTMAAQIVANVRPGLLRGAALVPVPLHGGRARRRGFNQAERIAAALARRSGLEVVDCLARSGVPGTQVGRGRAERLAGIGGSISLAPGTVPPRAPALLIDDVVTTGATLAGCAAALRADASVRGAVAYARTPGR